MRAINEHWNEAIRRCRIVARNRIVLYGRLLVYQVKHTLHGKIGLAASLGITAILSQVAIDGFVSRMPRSVAGTDGYLHLTHLWLWTFVTLLILSNFAKAFIKNRESEPLQYHPAFFPSLARHRVISSITSITLGGTTLYYVYWWQLLAARLDNLWVAIPIHLVTTFLLSFTSAIVIGFVGRKVLRRATSGGLRNPNTLENVTGGIAIGLFGIMMIAIMLAERHAQHLLEAIGNSFLVTIPIGMVPFAAALAADEGRWLALLGWLGLSAVSTAWAARAVYRWSFSAHREIPTDLASPAIRVFASVFTGRRGRWLPAGVRAFWRKDIVVPNSREPRRYLFHHTNVLWWGIMFTILTMALRNHGIISMAFADTVPILLILLAVALAAMPNGVNALGREGKELTWLRPIMSGPQLLARKLFVNCTYVAVHGVVYAFVLHAASQATALDTSFWVLVTYAISVGIPCSCLAIALGFLFPDFERSSSSLPGSTIVGKGTYMLGSIFLAVVTGTAHLLLTAGAVDGGSYSGIIVFALMCVTVGTVLAGAGALRQYRGMEI